MSDTVRMVGPESQQVYAVPTGQAEAYSKAGYTPYKGLAVDEGSIAERVQSWRNDVGGALQAWSSGELDSVPGVNSLVNRFAPDDVRKSYFDNIAQGQAQHPTAFKIGSALGTLTSYMGGERALSAGVGALSRAGVGAAQAVEGFSAAQPFAAGVLKSAAVSAAAGSAQQYDEMATKHALDPEGTEKLAFSYNHLALDTLLGAAGGAVGEGVSRIGKLGSRAVKAGEKRMAKAILNDDAVATLEQQGKGDAVTYARGLATHPKGKEGVLKTIATDYNSSAKEIESVRHLVNDKRVSLDEMESMVDKVQRVVGAEDNPGSALIAPFTERLQQARALFEEGKGAKAQKLLPGSSDLQKTFKEFYDKAYWDDLGAHAHSQTYKQAGEIISQTENDMVARVAGKDAASRLMKGKKIFSNTSELTRLMSKDELKTLGDVTDKAVQGAAFSALMTGVGAMPGTVLGAGGKGLFYSTVFNLNPYATGQIVRGMGKVISGADRAMVQTITGALVKGGQAEAHDLVGGHDYSDLASKVEAATRNPLSSTAANHEALVNEGVPEAAADKVALQNRALFQAAEEARPKRQGAADMVTLTQPDDIAQRKWVGWVRSAQDPTYALRNPTKANLDAARRFSPQVMQNAQNVVHEQVAKNPELGLDGKMWSSKLLGRPVSNIASPTFFQALRQQRMAAEAQAQGQQGGPPQRSAQGGNRLQSEQTRLGELTGG